MKKTLVLGASSNPDRYSNRAIMSLVKHNHPVVAIGQQKAEVGGVKVQTQQIPLTGIHTVSLYLNPKRQKDYYNYILELQPKRVIFNPGTENPEFQSLLKANKIAFEDSCTLVLLATDQYETNKG